MAIHGIHEPKMNCTLNAQLRPAKKEIIKTCTVWVWLIELREIVLRSNERGHNILCKKLNKRKLDVRETPGSLTVD